MAAAPKDMSYIEDIVVKVFDIEISEYDTRKIQNDPLPDWGEINIKTGNPKRIEWALKYLPINDKYKRTFLKNAREFIENGKEYLLLYYALCFIFPNEHNLFDILNVYAGKPIIALVRYSDKLKELKNKYHYGMLNEDANLKKYESVVRVITGYLEDNIEDKYSEEQIAIAREIIRLENISKSHSARVKEERGVGNSYYTKSNESWRGSLGISEQTAANTLKEAIRLRDYLPNSGGRRRTHRKRTHRKRAHKRTHRKRAHKRTHRKRKH